MKGHHLSTGEIAIKQKALSLLGKAIGITEPYDEESIFETIFRLQLFLPENIIQHSHYKSGYLLTFFHKQQQHFITINDLMILGVNSNVEKHTKESRREFSVNMVDRKAGFIKAGIHNGMLFLVPRSYNANKSDYLLLAEFPRHDSDWIYDIDIFSRKMAIEVLKCMDN